MSNEDKPFPRINEALLKELDRLFPTRSPQRNETERDRDWRGGQRDVVDLLYAKFRHQQNKD